MTTQQGLLLIRASAGSGKTYTLAKRYIELVLFSPGSDGLLGFRQQSDYHSHILAITFTNKATGEMKRRIVDELHRLATNPQASDFWRDFKRDDAERQRFADGTLEPGNIGRAARRALAAVLFGYGTFNVSTIDSFFQSILRNFARELDRDYNYEVQIDENFALRTAIHNFLLSLGVDRRRRGDAGRHRLTDVERWIKDYIRQQVSQGKDWNFFKDDGGLLDFAKLMNRELFKQQMPAMHDYLTRREGGDRVSDLSRIHSFRRRVAELAAAYERRYAAYAGQMSDMVDRHGVDRDCITAGTRLVNMLLKPDNAFALGKRYPDSLAALTEEKLVANSFKNNYAPPQSFINEMMSWRGEVILTWNAWQLLAKMPADLGLLALLSRIDDNLKQFSRETNQLLLADTNDLIARVLESGVPFLYERVGTWLNHFMIDEFQDTSRKQYDNFKPLLEEALARDGDNLCMLIGDSKQSIYRFRNADPSLFREGIARDFTAERHGLTAATLHTNYRSCPAVVQFNNWLFDRLLATPPFATSPILRRTYMPGDDKGEFCQLQHKRQPCGLVRVTRMDKDVTTEAERVLEALPDYLLWLHQRHEWRDIGILVNRRAQGNQVVECIMTHNKTAEADRQIAVTSDESMLIASSPSVKRIVSLLRFIDLTQYRTDEDNPAEDEPGGGHDNPATVRLREQRLYHVLGLFMERMSRDESQPPGQVLAQCFADTAHTGTLDPQQQAEAYAEEVDRLLPDRRTELMTLTNIVEHIIARYMRDHDTAPQETAHLLAFLDCVNDFSASHNGGTVREFLNFWDIKRDQLTVPASTTDNAVSVMTIHKSKGLEFDCVVIPFADWTLTGETTTGRRTDNIFWISREQWLEQGGQRLFDEVGGMAEDLIPPLLPVSKSEIRALAAAGVCMAPFVEKYDQDLLVDNMDKTYVAFTRPRQELHIFAYSDREVGSVLLGAIARGASGDDTEAAWQQVDEHTWQWGEPTDRSQEKDAAHSGKTVAMPPYRVVSGADRLAVRLPEDLTDKQNTGTRLHNLMSRIAYKRDLERAWGFCLNRGILRDDDRDWPLERVRSIIEAMFTDSRTRDWFDDRNRVYTERNLSAGPAAGNKTQRPDRVIRRPDGTWVVVDYKFGEKNLERHSAQVRHYMRRLQRMGKTPVQGYIWYVGHDDVIPVAATD